MIEHINSLEVSVIGKGVLFYLSAFAVLVYYHTEEWIKKDNRSDWLDYLIFDNPHKTYDAIKRLIILCMGAGVIGHLDAMTNMMVLAAGAGVGYTTFAGRENR